MTEPSHPDDWLAVGAKRIRLVTTDVPTWWSAWWTNWPSGEVLVPTRPEPELDWWGDGLIGERGVLG